jgi:LysR family transcriptional regulator for bpeEF and oprC
VIRGGELSDTKLITRRICELEYVTCATRSYIDVHGMPTTPSQLEQGHHLTSYFSSLTSKPFPLYFHRGEEIIEINMRSMAAVNESTAHINCLLAGLGIGQTFRFVARSHIDSGRLVAVLEDWTRPNYPLHVMYPPNRHLNAKLRVFVDWIAQLFGEIDRVWAISK